MLAIYRFLFPSKPDGTAISLLLLALRILFGGLLLTHGIQKWTNFRKCQPYSLIRWELVVRFHSDLLSLGNWLVR